MVTFEKTGIRPELLKAIEDMGFEKPMPVQEKVIPAILQTSKDIIALAQTGTGKTAAFGLPLLSMIDERLKMPQVLVLCPTRELCLQISDDLSNYSKYIKGINITAVYGGASIENQMKELKSGTHIIVATPGRMNDLIRRKRVNLGAIKTVVLDEADEMLTMGFKEELNAILSSVPGNRRTLLFSATMSKEISAIADNYMKDTEKITIGTRNAGSENVKHFYYMVNAHDRYTALKRIADFYPDIYGIIFCRTRQETKDISEKLMKDGYNADAIHGDLSQSQRDYVMQRFRRKNINMLVATDVAARGLDVDDLTHVINYNMPDEMEIYTHRSGRTGRAGKSGLSLSVIHSKEKWKIHDIEKMIHKTFQHKLVPGGREICEKQLFSLINKIEKVEINETEIAEFLPAIMKKTEWMSREEIVKRFVSAEFNRFLDYYKNAPDINLKENHSRGGSEKWDGSRGKNFSPRGNKKADKGGNQRRSDADKNSYKKKSWKKSGK